MTRLGVVVCRVVVVGVIAKALIVLVRLVLCGSVDDAASLLFAIGHHRRVSLFLLETARAILNCR